MRFVLIPDFRIWYLPSSFADLRPKLLRKGSRQSNRASRLRICGDPAPFLVIPHRTVNNRVFLQFYAQYGLARLRGPAVS